MRKAQFVLHFLVSSLINVYPEVYSDMIAYALWFCTVPCHVFEEEISTVTLLTYLAESCIVTVFLLAKRQEGIWSRQKLGHREWCSKMQVVAVRVLEIIVIITWWMSLIGGVFRVVLQWVLRKQGMVILCHIIMRVQKEISSGPHQKCLPVMQGCYLLPSLIYPR